MNSIIKYLVGILVTMIPASFFHDELKTFLDSVEKKILESETKIDDSALPLIKIIRSQLHV